MRNTPKSQFIAVAFALTVFASAVICYAPPAAAQDVVWVRAPYVDPCLSQNFLEQIFSSCPSRRVERVRPGSFVKVYPFGKLKEDYRAYGMTGVSDRTYFDRFEPNRGETRLKKFDPNTLAPPDIANPKLD